ncbi:MAG: hypothetical protein J6X20_06740, partial [Bacteroidales bacterium]|nr:hypothetical protein [Bacteroidales bacterium]
MQNTFTSRCRRQMRYTGHRFLWLAACLLACCGALHAQYSRLPDAYKLRKPFLLPYDFDRPGLGIDLQDPRNFR